MSDARDNVADTAPLVAELVAPPRTSSVSNVAIFSILLAVIGIAGLCFAGSLVVSSYNAAAPAPLPADATAIQRFENAITLEWQGVARRYSPALAGFTAWHLLVILLLIVGGIRLFRRTESARQLMLYVLLFVLLFEVLRSGLYLLMMLEMLPLVDQVLVRELRQIGAQNEQMEAILKRMAQGVTIVGILVALVWPALKILFYGWAARHLASPAVIESCRP